ncbi:MAG: OmpA family protein [Methylococcales bacterium]
MTQDELKAAVLAALIDYETLKKTRRMKAVKKALRGTVVATVIGSAGITTANQERNSPVRETAVSAKANADEAVAKPAHNKIQRQTVTGVAHFGLNRHALAAAHKDRLMQLIEQLPKDAELTVIGRTDSSGAHDYNKKLGAQRAKAVAKYLAEQGVKIKYIGSQISSNKYSGWMARGVDIIVSYAAPQPVAINLSPLVKQHVARSHHQHQNHYPPKTDVAAVKHNKMAHASKSVLHEPRSSQYAVPVKKTQQLHKEGSPQWWDEKSKVDDARLEKVSWADNPE